jgi:hypothetical protein
MKTVVRVENHRPVPLKTLKDLAAETSRLPHLADGTVAYLSVAYWHDGGGLGGGPDYGAAGWHVLSGNFWSRVDGTNAFPDEHLEYRRSTGRLLQPGERIVVTHEND